jgi:secondary thiamine-phosphate synthase enzyme
MAVFTSEKSYQTKAHMGMIEVTDDFQSAVNKAIKEHNISQGTITGFTTGGVAALTILEYEPGLVNHDLKKALDIISPYKDENGNIIHYKHHETWNDDNGSSHIKAALLSPSMVIPFNDGELILGPWQNIALVECDTRNRNRKIVFQIMGE